MFNSYRTKCKSVIDNKYLIISNNGLYKFSFNLKDKIKNELVVIQEDFEDWLENLSDLENSEIKRIKHDLHKVLYFDKVGERNPNDVWVQYDITMTTIAYMTVPEEVYVYFNLNKFLKENENDQFSLL